MRIRALNHGVFGLMPVMLNAFVLYAALRASSFAVDFATGQAPAGQRLLDGLSPYVTTHSTPFIYPNHFPFAYPASAAVFYAPFALMPHPLGEAVFAALDIAAVFAALKLVRIRDWRVYGVAFLWPAVFLGWQTANMTLLLALALAVIWRLRDRPGITGAVLALAISLKVILWPLAIWLIATRRYRALAHTAVWVLVMNLIAWGIVGYGQLPHYLRLAMSFSTAGGRRGYSLINLLLHLGAPMPAAAALCYASAAGMGAVCLWLGRAGHERAAFAVAVEVALLATPIIWLHYFGLLLVPLAMTCPRVGLLWMLPLLTLGSPATDPSTWRISLVLGLSVLLTALIVRSEVSDGRSIRPKISARLLSRSRQSGRHNVELPASR